MPLRIQIESRQKTIEELSLDTIMDACQSDESIGFCIECGTEHCNIEPDAVRYACESCELDSVYGAEELLLMSLE